MSLRTRTDLQTIFMRITMLDGIWHGGIEHQRESRWVATNMQYDGKSGETSIEKSKGANEKMVYRFSFRRIVVLVDGWLAGWLESL